MRLTRRIFQTVSLALLFCLSLTAAAQSPAKKTITHESMWLMKRVGAPALSPDGKWVVFPVVDPAYDDKDQTSDLWIAPTDGSVAPRRLTFTKGGESGADWSPDSQKVAFSAKREGDDVAQIYVIDVIAGGEAQRVTNISTGARSPQWRPDGKALLFVSSVFPGAADDDANKKIAADRKTRKYNARVYEQFPIRYWDHWLDDKQATILIQELAPGAKPENLLAGSKLITSPGFGGRQGDTSEELDAVWSPEGDSIVFSATTERNVIAYAQASTHLFKVSANGGEPVQLTSGKGEYGSPQFRPDGKALYASFEPHNEKEYNLSRVVMLGWPSLGQAIPITASFDRSVDRFVFSADSKTIYLLAEDSGLVKVYSVSASSGEVTQALPMDSGVYSSIVVAEKSSTPVVIGRWESSVNPAEVVKIDFAAKRHRNLTNFATQSAAEIDWQIPKHFWFTSKGGKRIHNMVVLPPNFDEKKKYPLLVMIHGGAHNMFRDSISLRWNYHMYTRQGYVLLLTNYTGSTGFGEKFAQAIMMDPLKTPGDEINQAVDEAIKQFAYVDGTRLAATGASYGGHLVNWLEGTTTRYKCLIGHAGLINLESQWGASDSIYHREVTAGGPPWENSPVWREQNPIRFGGNFKTPILISVGENDFRVPMSQTLENWSILQRMRVPSKLIVFPDENHWILKGENSKFYYGETAKWLEKYLGLGPS